MERNDLNIIEQAEKFLTEHADLFFKSRPLAVQNLTDLRHLRDKLSKQPIPEGLNIQAILLEKERAEAKHPNSDMPLGDWIAVVAEESGELTRAYLQHKYEQGDIEELRKEAIQTAATCVRFLEYLDSQDFPDYLKATDFVSNFSAGYHVYIEAPEHLQPNTAFKGKLVFKFDLSDDYSQFSIGSYFGKVRVTNTQLSRSYEFIYVDDTYRFYGHEVKGGVTNG